MTRKYSSTSVETTLASGLSSSGVTMLVAAGTASSLMGNVTLTAGNVDQFTVALDPDTANEEIVFVTNVSSDTLTIVRGQAGTSAITHSGGASIKHVLTSNDLDYYTSGVDSAVTLAGTQTLTNKDLSSATNTLSASVATLTGSQTLTNKTLTSPVINGATIGTSIVNLTLNAQTGTTYTPVLADNGKLVTLSNASAITLTVPTNASVAYATGAQINIQAIGAGQVTVVGDTGVTVNGTGTKLRVQWSAATLVKVATNTWTLIGDLA